MKKANPAGDLLRQFADPDIFEIDGGALGFEAEVTRGGMNFRAAGDFLAINPEADFTIDGADVIVIPLVNPFAQVFSRETAFSAG